MARLNRLKISQEEGSYHIISRTVGQDFLLGEEEKHYFVSLLNRFSQCFFVSIHAFCVMSNHFHILATALEKEGAAASDRELLERYRKAYFREFEEGEEFLGKDEIYRQKKLQSLRKRLTDISRFVQELKQTFSRWYNKKYDRVGYFWCERFKGVLISKGKAQLQVSAYIDLNPVRAGIVSKPEDYTWSSFGACKKCKNNKDYSFVQRVDSIHHQNDFSLDDYNSYVSECMELNFSSQKKNKNISSGLVFGSPELVRKIQNFLGRTHVIARKSGENLYSTRIFRSILTSG